MPSNEQEKGRTVTVTEGLDLAELREQNVARAKRWHGEDSEPWSLADWSNAMCGEAGEAANIVKKIRRHETSVDTSYNTPALETLQRELGAEIADVQIYLDLLAHYAGIDLSKVVRQKFNEVSLKQNFPEQLRWPAVLSAPDAFPVSEGEGRTDWMQLAAERLSTIDGLAEQLAASEKAAEEFSDALANEIDRCLKTRGVADPESELRAEHELIAFSKAVDLFKAAKENAQPDPQPSVEQGVVEDGGLRAKLSAFREGKGDEAADDYCESCDNSEGDEKPVFHPGVVGLKGPNQR